MHRNNLKYCDIRALAGAVRCDKIILTDIDSEKEYIIPDFTNEDERKKWENDTASPFPDENGNADMSCCSHPDYEPTEEDYANAEREWKEAGLIG